MPLLRRLPVFSALSAALWLVAPGPAGAQVVRKLAEPFDGASWQAGGYNRAAGSVRAVDDGAPGAAAARCLAVAVQFSGEGFEFFGVEPAAPFVIPGDAACLRLRVRRSDAAYGLSLALRDGWNREKAGGREFKFDLPLKAAPGAWESVELKIPADWVKPVRLASFTTHNWGQQSRRAEVVFHLDELEVETDLSRVDPATGVLRGWQPEPNPGPESLQQAWPTPLAAVTLSSGEASHVFSREEPRLVASCRNWRAEPLAGTLTVTLRDNDGQALPGGDLSRPFTVDSSATLTLPLPVPRFGRFHADARIRFADGAERSERLTFARLPPWRDLPEAAKDASPYGVNVHGGGTTLPLVPFRKAGLVWFRDYAFGHDVMAKANADRQWGGWPWFPRLLKLYADLGLRVMPCAMRSIPRVPDGTTVPPDLTGDKPPRDWTRQVADRLMCFPDLRYWELDNEYDLHKESAAAEIPANWARYRAYHRAFGLLVKTFGGEGMKAVENGRAGVWPDRLQACIASGDFADIDVVNVHHYTGVEPPEVNFGNMNTGFAGGQQQGPGLFFDRLREVKRAARQDGKPREAFLTEFGWDTLAGHVVTPREQAAYLVRGYLLAMAAGIDKSFWFYHYDSATPHNFFDGCGLLGPVEQGAPPKLSLCALAGLTWLLPGPRVVGQVNAGANTGGYVLEQDGQLVAVLFAIRGDDGPRVTVRARQLYDLFANPLPGQSVKLGLDPVYAVGLDRADPLFAQTAYDIDTPHLVLATAGDAVSGALAVRNNRAAAIAGALRLELPAGWQAAGEAEAAVAAAPGAEARVPFAFTVAADAALGEHAVTLRVVEAGQVVKELPLRVLVQEALSLQVGPITGRPGETQVDVKLLNRTAHALDGRLRLRLPATWRAPQAEIAVAGLEPGVVRTVSVPFTWRADWAAGERAEVAFAPAGGGRPVARPLIPNAVRIPKAGAITCDGDLSDWPEAARLPDWLLGSDLGTPEAEVRLAWSEAGLYLAARVANSKLVATDPRSFWDGDCLELFLDTADDKRHRTYEPGDHQFWFVPLAGEKRVYAGQWDRGTELEATRYDLPGLTSFAGRTADGYVVELLLPAQAMTRYRPAAGGKLGLCLNLTVHGRDYTRQVYWPWTKDWAVQNLPKSWGSVELGE